MDITSLYIQDKINNKSKIEIFWLTFIVLLFIFRTAIPFLKYPFIIFFSIFLFYTLFNYRSQIKAISLFFFKTYKLTIILLLILFVAFLFSNKMYLIAFKDVINSFILLTFFHFFSLIINDKKGLLFFLNTLIYLSIFFAFVICYFNFSANDFNNGEVSFIDYNFALIPIFFGYFGVFYKILKTESLFIKIFLNILLIVFSFNILLSGSRRGVFVLFIVVVVILIVHISNNIYKNGLTCKFCQGSKFYIAFFLIFSIIIYLFVFQASNTFKYKSLEIFWGGDVQLTKQRITLKVYRYIKAINSNLSYNGLFDRLWSYEFNPYDPRSGWGTRIHRLEYPLKGKNVEIVPKESRGYLMDSSCNAHTWLHNAYSYTKFISAKVHTNDQIRATVYCYVSKDFDGTWVRLSSEGQSYGNRVDYYDLKRKGEWQRLIIEPDCKEGVVPIYLYFSKHGVTDFSSLKGYVIFAYPQYEITKRGNSVLSDMHMSKTDFCYDSFFYIPKQKRLTRYNVEETNRGSTVSYKEQYQLKQANMLGFVNSLVAKISNTDDPDPFRRWVSKIFSEDTTYYGYKANINIDTLKNDFVASRLSRWQFAWQLFTKEYNWYQKIIGHGFDHLNWYGYYFYKDKTKSDWPHNPFLSVLLYSGILGLLVYLYFMYKVFYYYLKYIREYYILFIFFLITFFFSFFSAGSPFDPPVMGFFVMLPFLIHAVHKREKQSGLTDNKTHEK